MNPPGPGEVHDLGKDELELVGHVVIAWITQSKVCKVTPIQSTINRIELWLTDEVKSGLISRVKSWIYHNLNL